MAKLELKKSTTVGEFTKFFHEAFGAQVRVYKGRSRTEGHELLGNLGLTKEGVFECRANLTAGSFIERMENEFGLKVKVYTCDFWVAVLDGLTLESAGKVKKNAVKADMENMIAYQRTDDAVETAVVDIKKSATYGDYTINIASNNSVTVLKGGVACNNARGAMREVAALVGFEVDAAWTTQQLGGKLVNAIKNGPIILKPDVAEVPKIVNVNEKICVDGIVYWVLKGNELQVYGITDDCPDDVVVPSTVSYGCQYFTVVSIGDEIDWDENVEDDEFDEDDELSDTDSSTIDGKKIYEFYDNERLKSITLPDTLRFLGTEAILECENLDKVVIGCGIEKICINAIGFCPNLKLIEIHRDKSDIEFERAGKEFQGNSPQMVVQYIKKNRTVSGLEHIKEIIEMLKKEDVCDSGYSIDKTSIENIFNSTRENTKENILARLTVIDSLYSTQMGKRYYGLDELATVISSFSNLEELAAKFLKAPAHSSIFQCEVKCKKLFSLIPTTKTISLFNEKYGINKDGDDSGVAISLISKYLYFLTGYKFPIYDSIAIEMLPKLWEYCKFGTLPRIKPLKSSRDVGYGEEAISCFVIAINDLIHKLGLGNDPRKYDIVDRVLWYVGKICRGNLSLIINQDEYTALAQAYKKQTGSNTFKFDITTADLNKLPFLAGNKILKEFFILAKNINNQ